MTDAPASDDRGRPEMVDWDLAVRIGSRLAGDGPTVSRDEASAIVEELRAGADRSTGLVREFTGLAAAERSAPVLVVDRAGWVQANADAFATLLAPIVDKLTEKKPPTGVTAAIGSQITGAEVGGVLGFLGTKVLGQFDPFHEPDRPAAARRAQHRPRRARARRRPDRLPALGLPARGDPPGAVHRGALDARPPVRPDREVRRHHGAELRPARGRARAGSLEALQERAVAASGAAASSTSSARRSRRTLLDRLTGVMSLLEGHADVVMDGVGPTVIPSVAKIRAKFNERRKGVGVLDRVLRRVLGLDAKMAQYRDGAKFVRTWSTRPGWTASTWSGSARAPPVQGRDRRPERLDDARPRHLTCTPP